MLTKTSILVMLLIISTSLEAAFKTETLTLKNTRLHLTHWSVDNTSKNTQKAHDQTIILLSGPTDNWNSDSAWFARLAPKLSQNYDVISIDRAGQIFADRSAKFGYSAFGESLLQALMELKIKRVKFIAFASSNISLLKFSQLNMAQPLESRIAIDKIIMIDPDVLLPYSISRYVNDAKPFKENLTAYTEYVLQGKYQQRAIEKNNSELAHLKDLARNDSDTNWSYVDLIFKKRLEHGNIINLFSEIAIYAQDLNSVKNLTFPNSIPLVVFDTNFEQPYIDNAKTEDEKIGLERWKKEAVEYYHWLTNHSHKGQYLPLESSEHLLPFSQPNLIIESL